MDRRVGHQQQVKMGFRAGIFHVLLCELRIYFEQTRGDCRTTNQDLFGEFCFVYVEFYEAINLVLVL